MLDLGTVRPGETIIVPFHTFDSNDPSASVTLTGLAATDVEIYKDGGMTQRASDNGYTLLDTDGIDLDGTTGIHGISIDLADNSTAGFYSAGSRYHVVIASVTVDGATVNFIAATFVIGYPGAVVNTTIATLASQTSFTLTNGPGDDDALNGWKVVAHDVASRVQMCVGYVSDYTGSTKTVTLAADPGIFTMAATDNVSFWPPDNVQAVAGTTQTAGNLATLITTVDTVVDGIQTDLDNGTDGLGAIKTDTAAILVDTGTTLDGKINTIDTNVDAILVDTSTTLQAELDGIQADTEDLQTQIGAAGAGLTAVPWNAAWDAEVESEVDDALIAKGLDHLVFASVTGTDVADNSIFARLVSASATADWDDFVNTTDSLQATADALVVIDDYIDTEVAAILTDTGTTLDDFIDTEVAAIKAVTDQFNFGVANKVDANVTHINEIEVTGDGTVGTEWGPV